MSNPHKKPRKAPAPETTSENTVEPTPVTPAVEEDMPLYPGSRDLCVPGKTYRMETGGTIRFS